MVTIKLLCHYIRWIARFDTKKMIIGTRYARTFVIMQTETTKSKALAENNIGRKAERRIHG